MSDRKPLPEGPEMVLVPATGLLAVRDALIASDIEEAYHQLYAIADPAFREFEPWQKLENAALTAAPKVTEAPGLREALEEAAIWHDSQDKAISKQPNANIGRNGWMRNEHQEQADLLRAALSAAPQPAVSHSESWMGLNAEGFLRATRLSRVAEIWRDQGLMVLSLPAAITDDLLQSINTQPVSITERIVRAAMRHRGKVYDVPAPGRHHHVIRLICSMGEASTSAPVTDDGGFLTSAGRYVDREEAWTIAEAAGQLLERAPTDHRGGCLYSEDVW